MGEPKITLHIYDNDFTLKYQNLNSIDARLLMKQLRMTSPEYLNRRKLADMKGWTISPRLIASFSICSNYKCYKDVDTESVINGIPLGLLGIIIKWAKCSKIKVSVINCLVKNTEFLKSTNVPLEQVFDLRQYQIDAAKELLTKPMGLCKAITGAGKTRIMSAVAIAIGKPVVFLMYSKTLVPQWEAQFKKMGYSPTTVYEGKVRVGKDPWIIIGTFQSIGAQNYDPKKVWWIIRNNRQRTDVPLHSRILFDLHPGRTQKIAESLPGYPDCIKTLIVDEAHTAPALTYYSTASAFGPIYKYGCTATPMRESGDTLLLHAIFSDRVVSVNYKEVAKHLVVPELIHINVRTYLGSGVIEKQLEEMYGNDYTKMLCSDIFRLTTVVSIAKHLMQRGIQVLIVCGYMWYVEEMSQLLDKKEFKYEIVAGKINQKVKERNLVKQKLANKEIDGVITTTTFDVGVDVPSLQAILWAYPFTSSIKTIQRAGRVARQSEGKSRSMVIDLVDINLPKAVAMARKRAKVLKESFKINVAQVLDETEIDTKFVEYLEKGTKK